MKNYIKTEVFINYMNEHKLSKTEFCKLCKISLSTFNSIMAGGKSTRLGTVLKMLKAMNEPITSIFY